MNRLNDPHGVCASCQYVYVSNDDGHNVSVFTTAGRYACVVGCDRIQCGWSITCAVVFAGNEFQNCII